MKVKMAFVGLLVGLFVLNTLPVQATDLSGYVKATYLTHWKWGDPLKYHIVLPTSNKMMRDMWHEQIENVGEIPLTDAVWMIAVTQVTLYDASDNPVLTITDPEEIAQVVRLDNSDELWQGNYVIWIGTIQPGHSKRVVFNWWYGELLASWEHSWGIHYEYLTWQGLWYLP